MINNSVWDAGTALGTIVLALVNIFVLIYLGRQTKIAAATAASAAEAARIAKLTLDSDHERRRRQSTLEYWTTSRQVYYRNYASLMTADPSQHPTERLEVREYLGMLEAFAVGIRTGLFDFDVASDLAGGFILRICGRFDEYLSGQNKRTEGRAYRDLLRLRDDLTAKYQREGDVPALRQSAQA